MAAKLAKPIKREIRVYGVDAPIIATFKPEGIEMSVVGNQKKVFSSWPAVVNHLFTPNNVVSYLKGQPLKLLQKQAEKYKAKQTKKAEAIGV